MTSEKVKALAREAHGNICPNSDAYTFERGYIHGYEDALDKACEWLESHFRDIENPDFYSKRNHPTDLESMYHWSVKELVNDFRKAMEEE